MDHLESAADGPTRLVPAFGSSRAGRGVLLGATVLISGFISTQAPVLWSEWQQLRRDWEVDRLGRPIGFIGIAPNPSFAQPPLPWYREDADGLLLYSDWDESKGHRWYRLARGDLDGSQLERWFNRDVIRAIDRTILEKSGGQTWGRMQPDTPVIDLEMGGVALAYPMLVLEKVEAVNDTVGGRPVLVLHTPFVPEDQAVTLFDPVHEGRRLTFGLTGYLRKPDARPLLYDRQTESLWSLQDREFVCLGGELKGATLARLGRGTPMPWSQWVSEHPGGQLVAGAQRPAPPPPMPRPARTRRRAQVSL